MLTLEREVSIEMFHGDEVNEEAALFAIGPTKPFTTHSFLFDMKLP